MSGVKSINKISSLSHIFVDDGQWPPITNFLCDLDRWPQLETVSKIWAFYINFKNHMHYAACTKFDVTKCRNAPILSLTKIRVFLLTLLPPKFIKFKPMNHLFFFWHYFQFIKFKPINHLFFFWHYFHLSLLSSNLWTICFFSDTTST